MLGGFCTSLQAQDDDMYFVPTKQNVARDRAAYYGIPADDGYYSGSSRSVDEYNRRWSSQYEVLPADTGDVISFAAVEGVYPDSVGDYQLTQRMTRFDGYEPSAAYWAGYNQGRSDSWGWHSPWYYSYYPWYDSYWYWNDPWYWDYGWYDPWYYHGWGWGGYYSSWYYRPWLYSGYYYGGGGGYAHRTSPGTHNHGHVVGASPRSHSVGSSGFGGTRRAGFGSSRASSSSTRSGSTGFGSSRTSSGGSTFGGSRTRTTSSHSVSSYSSGSFGGSSSSGSSYTPSRSTSSGGSYSSGGGSFGGSRSSGGGGGGVSHSSGGGGSRGGGGGFGGSRR